MSLQEPKPGDLIEISRIIYEHWAIYVGDGYVVHLTVQSKDPRAASSSMSLLRDGRAVVRQERLEKVVKKGFYKVNNDLDRKYRPLPVEEVVRSAKKMVGKEVSYSLLGQNCEHFVTDLRYGKPLSRQVEWLHDAGVPKLLENLGIVEESCAKEDAEKSDSLRQPPKKQRSGGPTQWRWTWPPPHRPSLAPPHTPQSLLSLTFPTLQQQDDLTTF